MTEADRSLLETKPVDVETFNPAFEHQRVLSSRQLAQWLRIPVDVLERKAAAGTIPGQNLEGEWRFGAVAINEWLAGETRAVDPQPGILQALSEQIAALRTDVSALVDQIAEHRDPGKVFNDKGRLRFELQMALSLDRLEEEYIRHALDLYNGNKTQAAEYLQIDPSTLYRKLARYPSG